MRRPTARISPWLIATAFTAVFAALAAGPAAADYRQSYLDGLDALERGDLELAVSAFERAIAERPTERSRARLVGAIPQPYLPHHHLGVAFFRLRRCERAVEEWALSSAQGAIDTHPELAAEALAGRRKCELLAAAAAALATGERAAEPLAGGEGSGGGGRRFDEELEARRVRALEALAAAREALAAGRREWDFERIAEALEEATRGGRELTAVEREARRRWEEDEARRRELARESTAAAERPASAEAPPPEPAGAGGPLPAPRPPDDHRRPDRPAVPPAVGTAIEAFFAGDYQRTAELLDAFAEPSTERAALLVPLFRGAARYALFLTGGESDPELYRRAVADLETCLGVAPGFRPEPAHFSPRFVELYRRLGVRSGPP